MEAYCKTYIKIEKETGGTIYEVIGETKRLKQETIEQYQN